MDHLCLRHVGLSSICLGSFQRGNVVRVARPCRRECCEPVDQQERMEGHRNWIRPHLQSRGKHQDKEDHRKDRPRVGRGHHGFVFLEETSLCCLFSARILFWEIK